MQHFKNASTSIIIDKRIKRKDNTYAIKLRVTYNRIQKYYPLGIHLSTEDWDKTQVTNPRGEFKNLKITFNRFEQRAIEIIRDLQVFNFNTFNKRFIDDKSLEQADVFSLYEEYIKELNVHERTGTAISYNNSLVSFRKYINDNRRSKLPFENITIQFLNEYEKWMITNGCSITTVGIYVRCMRSILNQAIQKGYLKSEDYPFGNRKYQIPASRNIKKSLTINEIKSIVEYIPVNKSEEKARDLWLFCYLCNGLNIKDLSLLKFKNIDKNKIQFIRSKTERSTKKDLKPIIVMRISKIDEIIRKWGSNTLSDEDYVFNIIDNFDSPIQKKAKVNQATKTINKYMKRIGEKLNIEMELTTYTARHSFATILKRSGASTEFISESLGHKDLKTTENYLGSFEDEVKVKFQNKLLDFSNEY